MNTPHSIITPIHKGAFYGTVLCIVLPISVITQTE